MKTSNLQLPDAKLRSFCEKWKVRELSLFGSVLREDFRSDSDVDVLVQFTEDAQFDLFDLVEMERELSQLLGRQVDLVERQAVERSENYIRRQAILGTAERVYVAR